MKILLVDDENLIRIGIKTFINHLGDHQVYECSNGAEAIDIIRSQTPDIVFTDIKMPVMNGIELIKKAKSLQLNSNFIVLSCFDDFDYVRESLKHGALDYMLKHKISIDEISILLEFVKNKINFEKNCNNETPNKKYIIMALLKGEKFSLEYIQANLEINALRLSVEKVIIAFMEINRNKPVDNMEDNSNTIFNLSVINLVDDILNKFRNGEIVEYKDGLFFIAFHNNDSSNAYPGKISVILNSINNSVKQYLASYCRFAIITDEISYNDLFPSLEKLNNIYDNMFFCADEFVMTQNTIVPKAVEISKSVSQLYQYYTEKLLTNPCDFFSSNLDQLFYDIINKYSYNKAVVKLFLKNFIHQFITDQRRNYFINLNDFYVNEIYYKKIDMCNDISQLKSLTKEIVRGIIKSNDNFQSVSPALVKVIDYMRKYYMQDLTLTKIAGIIIINPSYLSRLFKEQIGKNLIEYLIMIRIEAAVKLMGNANMNIKEISEKCGFKNSQYFSKVFKKHTGLKPLEFRHSMYFQEENQK